MVSKKRKYYDKYALYRKNAEQIDPNLPDVEPDYGEVYTDNIEEPINYLNPRSTRGGRRRRMKQTKRKRRKQTKRLR